MNGCNRVINYVDEVCSAPLPFSEICSVSVGHDIYRRFVYLTFVNPNITLITVISSCVYCLSICSVLRGLSLIIT